MVSHLSVGSDLVSVVIMHLLLSVVIMHLLLCTLYNGRDIITDER